jgi:hypothetical protein
MPGPNFTFAFIIATLFGAVFHLIVGGDARRLTLFLLAGWLGFAMGQLLGDTFIVGLVTIGELRIIPASLGAILALIVALVFTTDRVRRHPTR